RQLKSVRQSPGHNSGYGQNETEGHQCNSRRQRAIAEFLLQIDRGDKQEEKKDKPEQTTGHAGAEERRSLKKLPIDDGVVGATLEHNEEHQQRERETNQAEGQFQIAIATLGEVQAHQKT